MGVGLLIRTTTETYTAERKHYPTRQSPKTVSAPDGRVHVHQSCSGDRSPSSVSATSRSPVNLSRSEVTRYEAPGRAGDWPRLVAYDLHGFTASECTAPYADVDTRVAAIRAPRSVRQTPSKCQKDERKKRQRTDARNRTGCFQRNSIDWGLTALPASGGSRNFERGRAKNIYCKV